ncbi:hypothetical protein EV643_102435 [Kribbella sp. VKM Ac-2527]|uniref:Dienelactone hydrolase n=1 Tax=Kribbella caucasensis TaxID=2512215 RepID=A0A4R6KNL5_9ACTN|nr:hypothetical protein [Kribbella sp. VKM Ac-2527]TDO52596.1 hypothetical protein EV643_102435 [Kribbella sp. VKM Ac-2527]
MPVAVELPADLRVERRWTRDGIVGEELSYSVGFGPRTVAWLLRPAGATRPLPGVLALHGHDGNKYYGKEKIADGPDPVPDFVAAGRSTYYEGRAFANDLARDGFAVLVTDAFAWGSRRFPLPEMPPRIQALGNLSAGPNPGEAELYNAAASHHEHLLEKYCSLLGTTFAAVVAREDRIALNYLRSRPDTTDFVGSVGLSGGGCRSALLQASSDHLSAAVIVGMMGTYDSLLDHSVVDHTWMLMPAGFARHADWPDLAACRTPAPLLVQYNRHDELFPHAGAQAAHARITAHYATSPSSYTGLFYDGPHKFDQVMQQAATTWLHNQT